MLKEHPDASKPREEYSLNQVSLECRVCLYMQTRRWNSSLESLTELIC